MENSLNSRRTDPFSHLTIFCAIFLCVFAFYLYSMNPTVAVGDSGEYIAAASTLGLPHAPSYPLYILLSRMGIESIPWADASYRVNLISVISAAGMIAIFVLLLLELRASFFAALAAATFAVLSKALWEHSLAAEVFSLNGLFAIAIFYVATMQAIALKQRVLFASFLLGLAVGNHQTIVVIVPGLIILWAWEVYRQLGWQEIILLLIYGAISFVVGMTIYIYLPVRSIKNPDLDWSNPENLHNFLRVLLRKDYGSFSLSLGSKLEHNASNIGQQTLRYFQYFVHDLGLAALLIVSAGWVIFFRKCYQTALAVAAIFLFSAPLFLILGNMPFDAQSQGILPRFYLLPTLFLLIAIAWLWDAVPKRWVQAVLLAAAGIFLLLHTEVASTAQKFRNSFFSYDYGWNLLRTLPPNAILFMDGGDDTFYTLAYRSLTRKERPDLELHDRGGLIFPSIYGADFRSISKVEKDQRRIQVESGFLGLRPVYYSTLNPSILPGVHLIQRGILYEAQRLQEKGHSQFSLWPFYILRGFYSDLTPLSYRVKALLPLYSYLRGVETKQEQDLNRALAFAPGIPWLSSNIVLFYTQLAYEAFANNDFAAAETLYKKCIALDPNYIYAYMNLGILYERTDRLDLAESFHKKSIELDPTLAQAYYNLAVLYWKQSRWDAVVPLFEKVLEIEPQNQAAQKYLWIARNKLTSQSGR